MLSQLYQNVRIALHYKYRSGSVPPHPGISQNSASVPLSCRVWRPKAPKHLMANPRALTSHRPYNHRCICGTDPPNCPMPPSIPHHMKRPHSIQDSNSDSKTRGLPRKCQLGAPTIGITWLARLTRSVRQGRPHTSQQQALGLPALLWFL